MKYRSFTRWVVNTTLRLVGAGDWHHDVAWGPDGCAFCAVHSCPKRRGAAVCPFCGTIVKARNKESVTITYKKDEDDCAT